MKTIVITGASSGIGAATAQKLSANNKLVLLVRNAAKMQKLTDQWEHNNVSIVEGDLSDLKQVERMAKEVCNQTDTIDILVNNAGGIFEKRQLSANGYEMHFALNHLSHFLLTQKLLPLLQQGSKIINVSSEAHRMASFQMDNIQLENNYGSFKAYANSKLYNIFFSNELHNRYFHNGISSYSLHPGVVKSGFAANTKGLFGWIWKLFTPFMITPEKGAATSVFLTQETLPESYSGKYFKNCKPVSASLLAEDSQAAKQFWEHSQSLI